MSWQIVVLALASAINTTMIIDVARRVKKLERMLYQRDSVR